MNQIDELVPWLQKSRVDIMQLRQAQSLSHALLFMGKDGGGHHQLAGFLAQDLLCQANEDKACGECHACHLMKAKTHPDFHFLDGREETIKVDQVRDILVKVSTKPQIGNSKVVVLAQAASMNINSANAILKALEEPPSETFFILTSDANSSLLPTIKSRCMLVKLPSPSESQVSTWLNQYSISVDASNLLWVTEEPFTLLALAQTSTAEIYQNLPDNIYRFLLGQVSLEDIVAKVDTKNSIDFIRGLLALTHQCIRYSTGAKVANLESLQLCFDTLLTKLGIHKVMQCFGRLQTLVESSHKTHLNMPMQIKAELLFWAV